MAKNRSQSVERRARLAAIEAKQKKKETVAAWAFGAGGILLVIGLVAAIFLIIWQTNKPIEALAPADQYAESESVTNRVKLNISYTDNQGKKHVGDVIVELDPTQAPLTVKNFQNLVKENFYDGLTFHRIIEGFMIQGGDPKGNGTGGSENSITGEFSANGVTNNIKHERGTISMARATDYNSASSQFFIVHQTSAGNTQSLDGKYAAFGKVIFGMETVDGIAALSTDSSNKPLNSVVINSATFIK